MASGMYTGIQRLPVVILCLAPSAVGVVDAEQFLWQTNSEGHDIHVFRLRDFQLVHRLEVGPEPHGIAAPDDGRVVYVSLERIGRDQGFVALADRDQVAVVDAADKRVVRYLDVGKAPKRNLVLVVAAYAPIDAVAPRLKRK